MRKTIISAILVVGACGLCSASVSTNVPLGHWSYDALDKLIGYRLINSAMMTIKPVSRFEMARHIAEAMDRAERSNQTDPIICAILERLKTEFRAELIVLGSIDGEVDGSFIKPIEDPYVGFLYAKREPDLENRRGDVFYAKSNYRAGFASRAYLFDNTVFYLHPEYRNSSSGPDGYLNIIEGYIKVAFWKLEVEAGKDSLWWGPGYHGSILMSNNIQPLPMVKIANPEPIKLPWVFESLGPFKMMWFLAQLEKNRPAPYVSNAKITGVRFNFKPRPDLEFGLSRTILFDGSGRPSVGLIDYIGMFIPQAEQSENNQLAGFDVSFFVPLNESAPARSVRLYVDGAGEDEAGFLPSKWGWLFGLQISDLLKTGRTDLRVEYANNHVPGYPNVFYTHNLYEYSYKGRVIGHHMGTDADDLFVQVSHYLTEDVVLDLTYDRQVQEPSYKPHQTVNQFGLDLTVFVSKDWQLETGYRYDTEETTANDNHIFQIYLIRKF